MTAAISVMKDLLLLLEQVARAGRLLFVIAEEEPPACRTRTPWPGRSSVTRGCGLQRQRATGNLRQRAGAGNRIGHRKPHRIINRQAARVGDPGE